MRRRSFLAGSAALLTTSLRAATPPSEMVQITPDLITAAQKEGRVLARYSSPVDVGPHGVVLTFRDPDNRQLEIYWRPASGQDGGYKYRHIGPL